MGVFNTYLALFLVVELAITDMALAQLPGTAGRQIQPALTLALALTSLVLLLFYIYLRKEGFRRSNQSPKKTADTHPDLIPRMPLANRLLATDEALCHLFNHHTIPMAKSTLEQGRILDANPSFCRLLGCPRKNLLGKTWVELGMIPAMGYSNQQLVEQGWMKSISPFGKSGQILDLSILSLLVPPEPDQSAQSRENENWQVLTIFSDPTEGAK